MMHTRNLPRGRVAMRKPPMIRSSLDVLTLRTWIANVMLVGLPGSTDWVLVDAGMPGSAHRIRRAAAQRFGEGVAPRAILLTHAHFDHVGALGELAEDWDVPVYAHGMEFPYLLGQSKYPPPDPTVGGGIMARTSPLLPLMFRESRPEIGHRLRELPADGTVPHLPEWRWVFTPGHSPGHVAFFRDADRLLIAGDAFVTTKQESLLAVLSQYRRVHGPPMYYTIDWEQARNSVALLAALEPEVAATGHGVPMAGEQLRRQLEELVNRFDELAMPCDGRYVREPARADETGITYTPPAVCSALPKVAAVAGIAGIAAVLATRRR